MKKTVFLLAVLVVSLCFTLAGCNNTLQAKAISIFDDSSYILPITPQSANWHGNGTDFVSDLTLEEIKNEINKQSSNVTEDEIRKMHIQDNVDTENVTVTQWK